MQTVVFVVPAGFEPATSPPKGDVLPLHYGALDSFDPVVFAAHVVAASEPMPVCCALADFIHHRCGPIASTLLYKPISKCKLMRKHLTAQYLSNRCMEKIEWNAQSFLKQLKIHDLFRRPCFITLPIEKCDSLLLGQLFHKLDLLTCFADVGGLEPPHSESKSDALPLRYTSMAISSIRQPLPSFL